MAITVDATKGWARPASSAECTELFGALVMNHWWPCTEASGDLVDVITGLVLTAGITPLYAQAATGWAGTGVAMTDATGDRFMAAAASGPDPSTTSQIWMFVLAIETEPTAAREFAHVGGVAASALALLFSPSAGTNRLRFDVCNVTATGSLDHPAGSYVFSLRYDRAVSAAVATSDLETVLGTYNATTTDGNKGLGSNSISPGDVVCLGIGLWTGATAEAIDDADIATIRDLIENPPTGLTTTGSPADTTATALDATTTPGTVTTTGAVAAAVAEALDGTAGTFPATASTTAEALDATVTIGPVSTTGAVASTAATAIDAGVTVPIGAEGVLTLTPVVEAGATITLSWLTNVLKFWSGKEQRIGINAHPRQKIEFSTKLTDAETRTMFAALSRHAHTAPVFLLALPHEALPVVSSTATTLTVPSLAETDWNVAGQRIVVVHPDGTAMETTVQPPPGGNVIAVGPDVTAVAVPGAQVMPLVGVHLEPNQALSRYRVNMGTWDLVAHVILPWSGASTTAGTGATVTTHDSMAVWEAGNQQQLAAQPILSGVSLVDLGGRIDAISSYTASDWIRTIGVKSSDPSDWQYLKAFLVAVHGMRKAWLLPTGRPDLVAVGDASSGTLTVDDASDYVNAWFPSLAHRRVKITLDTGAAHYRTVSACVDNGDGTQGLTLNAALAGTISRVEFLETVRFDSDEVVVEWGSGWQFATNLKARVVQQ